MGFFMLNKKIDNSLIYYLKNNIYNTYRVIIEYNRFSEKIIRKITNSNGIVLSSLKHINIIAAYVSKYTLSRLIELPEVSSVHFDEYCYICASPIGVLPSNQLRFSHNYKLSGKGITIGIIDTGVFPHKELLNPSNRIKYFEDHVGQSHYPYDDNGHGTFISGIICANGLYSNNMYKGLASSSEICAFKVFDGKGKGYVSDILSSIDTILTIHEEMNIRIICLAGEYLQHNPYIENLFNNLFKQCYDTGIIVVVPSGSSFNQPCSIMGFASSKYCITIGGYDTYKTDKSYPYSSYGKYKNMKKPDFVASSSNIISFNCDTSYVSERKGIKLYPHTLEKLYTSYSGTSCASAYVCSIIALMLEKDNSLSFKDVYSLLKLSSKKPTNTDAMVGNGLIDVKNLFT